MRLASGLIGELIGVEGSKVKTKVPAVGDVKVKVLVDQTTVAPEAPVVIVPFSVALKVAGFGDASPGTVKVTVNVNVAPVAVPVPVEAALKTPNVTLEDSPGFKLTLTSFGLEEKVMTVPPTVIALPVPLTVPPELPAPNLPDVLAVNVTGAANAGIIPKRNRVNAPSSQSVFCFFDRTILYFS